MIYFFNNMFIILILQAIVKMAEPNTQYGICADKYFFKKSVDKDMAAMKALGELKCDYRGDPHYKDRKDYEDRLQEESLLRIIEAYKACTARCGKTQSDIMFAAMYSCFDVIVLLIKMSIEERFNSY